LPKRIFSPQRMPLDRAGARVAILAAVLAFACAGAAAQVLYKWIDSDGKVQYSDRPPKNFSGAVTRIEPDEQPMPFVPAPGKPRAGAKAALEHGEEAVAGPDPAAARREVRRKLEADVAAARQKLEGAKAALEASSSPQDDERQVIQQKVDRANPAPGGGSASTGGMQGSGGMLGGAARSNCRTARSSDGKVVTTCATSVPNDAYYDRIKGLEDAVKAAEEELAVAEQAYRRGVD
jgi:Domain of unknown function (DUF4124)